MKKLQSNLVPSLTEEQLVLAYYDNQIMSFVRLVKKFCKDESIVDVVNHLNSMTTDALTLTDAEDEPFYNHAQRVRAMSFNGKIIHLLMEMNHFAKI